MTHDPGDLSTAHGDGIWREYMGKRVVVRTLDGSYASRNAASLLLDAEQAVEALEKLLEPPSSTEGRIAIYLVDPVGAVAGEVAEAFPSLGPASGTGVIVRVIRP